MKTAEQLANQMIAEMQAAGLSPDDMLRVIKMARERFEEMKKDGEQ